MSKTTNTINLDDFFPEYPFCGKSLSEIRRPSSPKYYPLYEKRDEIIFDSDQEYANRLFEYIQESEEKLSRKDTIRRLKSIKGYFNNETAQKIFNILISDVSCLDRIVFVNDGSYRTHRIWYTFEEDLCVDYINSSSSTSEEGQKAMKAFKRILEKFEKIFIQV